MPPRAGSKPSWAHGFDQPVLPRGHAEPDFGRASTCRTLAGQQCSADVTQLARQGSPVPSPGVHVIARGQGYRTYSGLACMRASPMKPHGWRPCGAWMCACMCYQRGPILLYATLPFAAGSHAVWQFGLLLGFVNLCMAWASVCLTRVLERHVTYSSPERCRYIARSPYSPCLCIIRYQARHLPPRLWQHSCWQRAALATILGTLRPRAFAFTACTCTYLHDL